jgi:hypothetical protein
MTTAKWTIDTKREAGFELSCCKKDSMKKGVCQCRGSRDALSYLFIHTWKERPSFIHTSTLNDPLMKLTLNSAMRIHILHKKTLTLLRVGFPWPKVQMVFLTEWQKVSLIDKLHHAHLPGWEVLSLTKKTTM